MTLEKLLEFPAADIESFLKDKQKADAFFAPMLNITRPDRPSSIFHDKSKASPSPKKAKGASAIDQFLLNLTGDKADKMRSLMAELDEDEDE